MSSNPPPSPGTIDWAVFAGGCGILLTVVLAIVAFPDSSASVINEVFQAITTYLGVLYIVIAVSVFILLLWLAFGRFGRLPLGEGPPVYSTFSWTAMMFCAGIGASVIYLGAIEWVYYYTSPPFGVEPRSDVAMLWATAYGPFHWGPVGWAIYALPAVAIACSHYLRGHRSLRMSDACEPLLGAYTRRWPGRMIDLLFIVGLIATAATGLGLGTSVVASATTELTSIENGFGLQASIIIAATVLIGVSVYRGLDRGILLLSNANAVLAVLLIAFVLFAGPTRFIAEMGIASAGHLLQNFVTMLTWTDPMQRSDFIESWTVFYWAWWIALGPFVGMFVCRISAGRTIRQLILGMLVFGSLGCTVFFMVLGNYALHLEVNGLYPVVEEVTNQSGSDALAGMINRLPFGSFWLVFLGIIGLVFVATSYDSASYVLAAGASRTLPADGHPGRPHRVFWACALGVLPLCLLYLGGLRVLQAASVVASVPILVVYGMLAVSMLRTLRQQ